MKFLRLVCLIFSIYSWGQQGNYKYNNFGNRSILLSGNVTGSVSDIGLVYYNPARLTELENTGFAFNAKAYQLNSLQLTTVLDEERQLENSSFSGVPSMAGGTFNLFGERFGYSFIARRRSDFNLGISNRKITDNIIGLFPDTEAYNLKASINSKVKEDWYGLTWAKKISENFSLGISAFASSYRYDGSRSVSHTIQYNQDAVAYYLSQTGFDQRSYGLHFKVGAFYEWNTIDLGLNINIPYLEVFEDGKYNYNKVVSGVGSGFDVLYNYIFDDLNTRRQEPLGVSIGAGIPIKKNKIHLNIDFVSGLTNYSRLNIPDIDIGDTSPTPVVFNEERQPVFNFGVGGEFYINERFKSYFGFSTDFNAFKENASAFDLSTDNAENTAIGADYYHFSGGIDWKMSWANIIFGATYASGSSRFQNPFNLTASGIDNTNTTESTLRNQRYQIIIGLEIPILDNTFNKMKKKTE
jgi:hypothetical protein